ncbi:MAG: hypothetical protein WBQ94_28430 [Terracidiphilus sp.]
MRGSVQARVDAETEAAIEKLRRRNGWSMSRVVREGLQLLVQHQAGAATQRMIGIGMLDSGVSDLASNKKLVKGFGSNSGIARKSGPKRKRKAA